MKLKTKLLLLSSAALTVTPLATSIKPVNLTTVQAAAKKKNTITVVASSPVYNNHGQEMPHYKGQDYFTFLKQTTLRYYGQPITIKGQRYYSIGQEAYVAAADLAKVNNKEILSLNHNSYVYTAKG
ncbi:SLAP domain-containing protein [Lactobacillus xujianguonis]|uniref:SLAP domain-containing protein n=1 Tax=Lactobacillus xujianguonis TaxID=2495899 RepID=UPI001FEEFF45|nr:SLAP domain-containing protein [Lactobacillus xujianguonis]